MTVGDLKNLISGHKDDDPILFITDDYDPYYAKEVAEKWVLMGGVVIYVDNK